MCKIAMKSDSFTHQNQSCLNQKNFTGSHKTIEEHCTVISQQLSKFYMVT